MPLLGTTLCVCLCSPQVLWALEPQVKSDEQVMFFPTAACWDEARQAWSVALHGWIYEPEEDGIARNLAIRRMREALGLTPQERSSQLFEQRVRWFLVDSERDKRVTIQIAGRSVTLDPSEEDGHIVGQIWIPAASVHRHARGNLIPFQVQLPGDDPRQFTGTVHLRSATGTTVISDIDDTIKISQVGDIKALLQRTFLEPFEAVPGMSGIYRQWAEAGAEFHYLSASPWQLYVPLSQFLIEQRFPAGTMQLKQVRVKSPSLASLLDAPEDYKLPAIESQLKQYPRRLFILVGDSGEKDPEIYGTVARKYRSQIAKILIRDVTGTPVRDARYQQAFRDVPGERWQLFQDAKELETIPLR